MVIYDLVIKDCLVIDPVNQRKTVASVAMKDGRIAAVSSGSGLDARQTVSFPNMVLMPGLIDSHTHVSDWIGGPLGFGMLAKAGVCTAIDFAGPAGKVFEQMREHGSGINIAVLEAIYPGKSVEGIDPGYDEISKYVKKIIDGGAIGLKLIGGHYPLTPEASSAAIRAANDRRCYMAVHSGSVKNGSNLNGALDTIEFARGRPFHLAHVNAYCRGMTGADPKDELAALLAALSNNPQIVSESHLAPLNGCSGKCVDGVPESHITRNCLRMGRYEESETGLRKALLEGYANCVWEDLDGVNAYVSGEKALKYWESRDGNAICAFPVNNRETAFLSATARDRTGRMVVDALSTDGGGLPRNFLLSMGLLLVEWGAWSLEDFVLKTSVFPARMFGLTNKGCLSEGADADITVFDPVRREALLTVVSGNIVCVNGVLCARNTGRVLCLPQGRKTVESYGLSHAEIDLEQSMLYRGR